MKISGFQPVSLLDYPGIVASIVFTQGCVFRCAYCHNPELIPTAARGSLIEPRAIFERLDRHARMIEGVCVTGGEPTLQPDLPDFLRQLKRRRLLVKLDTNGVHPTVVEALLRERLVDYIAMDLKQTWEKYDQVARTGSERVVENCRRTFRLIQDSGIAHEFRTTICPGVHTADDLREIATGLRPGERYYIQDTRFTNVLDPELPRRHGIDIPLLVDSISTSFPQLEVSSR